MFLLATASALRGELVDRIAAIVADSIISSQQIELFVSQVEPAVRERYRNEPEMYEKQMDKLAKDALEQLMERELILHDFSVSGFSVPESLIDEYVQDEITRRFSDRVNFMKRLQSEGMTVEQFRKQLRDRLIVDEMTRKFVPEPIISPRKIEAYYTAHHEEYKVEDQVRTRLIVINQNADDPAGTAKRRCQEILTQIKQGAAFDEMARVYSEGSQRSEGGEAGWQEVSVLNKALVAALDKLKPGDISDVIETPQACFIMQLEERRPAHYRPLSELRDDIEHTLMAEESGRLRDKWINRLKKKTYVAYF